MTDESSPRAARWFLWLLGQDDNIGDVVLRRRMLRAASAAGTAHVYVGEASAGFVDSLTRDIDCVVYRSKRNWYLAAVRGLLARTPWGFAFNPGEVRSRRHIAGWYRKVAPIAMASKLRGKSARLVSIGIGLHSNEQPWLKMIRRVTSFADVVIWRDSKSALWTGLGSTGIDWAFDENLVELSRSGARDILAISHRGDRSDLSESQVSGIRLFAARHALKINVVVQVRSDRNHGSTLASRLGAQFTDWPEERSHRDQEKVCRSIFSQSAFVVSDRIHALIIGASEGASPIGFSAEPDEKCARHFEPLGINEVHVAAGGLDSSQVDYELEVRATHAPEIRAAVDRARETVRAYDRYFLFNA